MSVNIYAEVEAIEEKLNKISSELTVKQFVSRRKILYNAIKRKYEVLSWLENNNLLEKYESKNNSS